jgi:hypothetical protein
MSMLAPDIVKPAVQLAVNRDFKEMPVINRWAKNTSPGYKRIRINKKGEAYAPQFLVDFARLSDNVTGGDGIKKGLVSFNPDEVQHITEGYFGGLYTTISQTVDMIYKGVLPEKEVKVRDTPLRRFYVPVDDIAPIGQGMNSKYRHIRNKVNKDKDLMKGYSDEAGRVAKEIDRLRSDVEKGKLDIVEFARKQTELNNRINKYEEEFNRMGTEKHYELKAYIDEIEKREERLIELEGQQQKDREIEIAGLKREVIEMSDGK